jgi:hypothetical protein
MHIPATLSLPTGASYSYSYFIYKQRYYYQGDIIVRGNRSGLTFVTTVWMLLIGSINVNIKTNNNYIPFGLVLPLLVVVVGVAVPYVIIYTIHMKVTSMTMKV